MGIKATLPFNRIDMQNKNMTIERQAELGFNQSLRSIWWQKKENRYSPYPPLWKQQNRQKHSLHTTQSTACVSHHSSKKWKEDYKHECMVDAAASTEYTQLKTTQFHP